MKEEIHPIPWEPSRHHTNFAEIHFDQASQKKLL